MKQFISFVKKEFYHIIRDNRTLLVILGMPVVQMLLFGFAINMEVKDVRIAIYNPVPDQSNRQITAKIENNPYLKYMGYRSSVALLEDEMRKGKLDLALIFPDQFHENLIHSRRASLQVLANSSDPNRGTIAAGYITAIIADYQKELMDIDKIPFFIDMETKMAYNSQMKSSYMFVPGIMGLVIMIISTIMTSVSIIREKERGTMEVLLASPMRQGTMVVAKTIPYFIISLINFLSILVLSYFVLHVPVRGNLLLLLLVSVLYIFLSLSFGLLISTLSNKQINAVIISAISVMIPVLLLSGMIFPIKSMPSLLQYMSLVIPARWFIAAVRKIMIQGEGIMMVWKEVVILAAMAGALLIITTLNMKKRLE